MCFLMLRVVLSKLIIFWNFIYGFFNRILVTPRFMKQLFDPREGGNAQVNAEREAGNGPGGFDWGDNE